MESKITDARLIVATRNVMVHVYHAVSDDIVWGIAMVKVPVLKREVEQIIKGVG